MVLIETRANRQTVAACDARAQRAGVARGMSLVHARALLPREALRVETVDPAGDREALQRLAVWATALLPRVMADPDGPGLLADVTGCARLYRGEHRLVRRLGEALHGGGLSARIAVAPTYGAAWAFAHSDGPAWRIVQEDAWPAELAPLPVTALRVDGPTAEALADVGVETIGQLRDLPRSSLPSRFAGELLRRLDEATGGAWEAIEPVRQEASPAASRTFAGPVKGLEVIERAARELVGSLCEQLLEAESGVSGVVLEMKRYEAEVVRLEVGVSRPSRDARHLWQLLWPKLERAHLGHGVEGLTLTATTTARLPHRQLGPQRPEAAHERELAELLDTLSARLGPRRVSRIEARETHQPERVYRRRPADGRGRVEPVELTANSRPSRLLHPPEPVRVWAMTPDGPVLRLRWRGQEHEAVTCQGPERIGGEWWRGRADPRDYFRVQTGEGRWLWVYRRLEPAKGDASPSRWFVHGLWA